MIKFDHDIDDAARRLKERGAKRWKKINFKTVLVSCSRSGMSRKITLYVETPKDGLFCLGRDIRVDGCGMDMGFHLAYNVYTRLYPYVMGKQTKPYQDHMKHDWL
jgi:hypothetical protein